MGLRTKIEKENAVKEVVVGCEKHSCVVTCAKVEFWLYDRVITAGDVVGNKVKQSL